MAIVTQSQAAQSSSAVNGQSTSYLKALVLAQVSGAPDSLVQSMLNLTLSDFYGASGAWRDTVGPYVIAANIPEIQLNPVDAYSQVTFVFDAWIFPTSSDNVNGVQHLRVSPRRFLGTDTGPPTAYFMRTPDTMVLYPKPNANLGAKLYVFAALTPTLNTPQLPDISISQHIDALLDGTLARLFAIPNRPYTNKAESNARARAYKMAVKTWRDMANRGNGTADTPWRYPCFAGTGTQRNSRSF